MTARMQIILWIILPSVMSPGQIILTITETQAKFHIQRAVRVT